jgi:predicted transposase/invertase (TIGR01784 family)
VKTDSLFYRLFHEQPGLVFELAGWPLPATGVYALHAEEVKQTSFRLDGVLLPPPESPELPAVFVEAQFRRDPDFYSRWFAELCLFLHRRRWRRPWRAVVIFPSRAVDGGPSVAHRPFLDNPQVKRVYLEDLTERTDLTPGLRLIRLIVAEPAVAVSQAQVLLRARGGPDADPDWRNWLDLIETILVYKLPRLTREEIQRMLHLPDVELKQTRFYQDAFAEGRDEGRAEGRDEGRAEGRDEGLAQGRDEGLSQGRRQEAAALVSRLLRRRLGEVPGDVESRVRALPLAELEALGEAVLDLRSLDELIAWLEQRETHP